MKCLLPNCDNNIQGQCTDIAILETWHDQKGHNNVDCCLYYKGTAENRHEDHRVHQRRKRLEAMNEGR